MIEIKKRHRHHINEIAKYSVVGISSTALCLLLIYIFKEYFGLYYVLAGALSYAISGIYNFSLNKVWTFREEIKHKIIKRYTYFLIMDTLALIVTTFLLYIFTEFSGAHYLISQLAAIILVALIVFWINKIYIFNKERDYEREHLETRKNKMFSAPF